MVRFQRHLDLVRQTRTASRFLFGPRGTGKSFLIRETLPDALVINLLSSNEYLRLAENPSLLHELVGSQNKLVVIDEVQKLPALLDEVHTLIEERKIRFLLTGSSARKLKRGAANLLAGRARTSHLFPLTSRELPNFSLQPYLLWGGLPEVWNVDDRQDYLDAYIDTYLKEVLAEQIARSLPHFARFLKVAALSSGELANFANLASDSQLPASTVRNYFQALEDTLVGSVLDPWTESKKRKAIATGKFYFFDVGVRNRILGITEIVPRTETYGQSFEHFIFMELRAYASYSTARPSLHFWRSVNHHEVDFVLGGNVAIEVKAARKTSERDAKGLRALAEEGHITSCIVVSEDALNREAQGIQYLHWSEFLRRLWSDCLFD